MILALVFSRDRALQLDATLRSFFRQAVDAGEAQIVVLYRASSERLRAQYGQLGRELAGRVLFIPETEFRGQLIGLLQDMSSGRTDVAPTHRSAPRFPWQRPSSPVNNVLFVVDDALFVRHFHLGTAVEALQSNTDAVGFSFRLGRNTTNSYVLERSQVLPEFVQLAEGMLKYPWRNGDGDFAYPLELSSSLYRAPDMLRLFRGLEFSNPNTLESQMSIRAGRFARRTPYMLCWERSVAFSAPVNRVQTVFENRVGQREEFSLENMSAAFDRGQRIDVARLDGFVPSACHQEVRLSLVESGA